MVSVCTGLLGEALRWIQDYKPNTFTFIDHHMERSQTPNTISELVLWFESFVDYRIDWILGSI